ncbi:hypothetical protein [Sporosarcina limicola]|uniref:Secreted protein n=1 Tax=Sporosarcina limicola TaxID=34101 RepID=A0A927MJN6_9BACL|nr:hypothetical protein [Sporosarcina limicola]MBE1554377.1 hypothetical protein [Sporosarcina limicola]
MKKLLMSVSTLLLVLLLSISSFQLKSASAISLESNSTLSLENPSDLIEPFGYDDEIPYCKNGTYNSDDGESYVTLQTNTSSTDRSIQWGYFIKPSAYHLYKPKLTVSMSGTRINDQRINSPYPMRDESPNYLFHGSIKVYQIIGGSNSNNLKSGDILNLVYNGIATTSINGVTNNTYVGIECVVR